MTLVAPSAALAYGSRTHRTITHEAVRAVLTWPDEEVACPEDTDLGAFLRWLHGQVASAGTPDAAEFRRRWPDAAGFDAFEAKGFLDLTRDPGVRVAGVDFLPCDDDGTALGLLATESVRPDDDGRNLWRLAVGPDRRPLAGPIPEDPIALDLGGLDGLASQAHAHYLLAENPGGWLARGEVAPRLTASPLALWRDPAHFAVATAVPGGPFSLGADMAMEHLLLALLARAWPDPERGGAHPRRPLPAAKRLSLAFLGHALHYVQDASDPLHTVQVGDPCVVWHGMSGFVWRALLTAGGYTGPLAAATSAIADTVSNLHLWTESFWDAQDVVRGNQGWARAWGAVAAAGRGDLQGALLAAWRAAEAVRPWGPALYDAACRAVSPRVLEYGEVLKDGAFDAEALLDDAEAGREVARIGQEAALVALAESVALVRAYVVLAPRMDDPDTRREVAALLATRVRAIAQREARLAAWTKDHPDGVPPQGEPVRIPAVLVLEAVAVLLVAWWAGRQVRRSHRPSL